MKLPYIVIMKKTLKFLGQRHLRAYYNYRTPPTFSLSRPSHLEEEPGLLGGVISAGPSHL